MLRRALVRLGAEAVIPLHARGRLAGWLFVGGRATGVQAVVTLQLTLTDKATGAVLFSRPGVEFRERYEISVDPTSYFDESTAALERLSRDVARTVVSAVLENF